MNKKTSLLLAALTTGVLAGQAEAQIAATLRATDTASPDAGLNVTSYVNPIQGDGTVIWNSAWVNATTGGASGDSFTIMNRTDSVFFDIINQENLPTIPFAQADDSVSIFPGDTQGFIAEDDLAPFFGVTDTENNDNSGTVTATWVFDISAATSDVEIKVDLAAMGDFEAADVFNFNVGLDAGPLSLAGAFSVDEDGSNDYTMDDGTIVSLNDPLLFNGTILNEDFATFSLGTIAGSASASSLTLTFDAVTNGGSEAVAFRNIVIDEVTGGFAPADLDMDGDVDDGDFGLAFAAFTGPNNGPSTNPAADLDGDGDVDDGDFGLAFAAFTGPGGAAAVPEPTSLALLALGGLLAARRRRS